MNKFYILSLISFIGSILLLFLGFLSGEIKVGLFLIFPFIAGSGLYSFFGIILLFLSLLLFLLGFVYKFSSFEEKAEEIEEDIGKKSVEGGGLVLIGPIPIVISSNWKIALALMLIAAFIIVILTILHFY